jgi:spore coat protein CotF
MNNNTVSNPKTEVPQTVEMNDRDYINDVLEGEKNMTNNLSIVLNEASNETFFKDILDMFSENQAMARSLYNLMFQKGWYSLEKAEQTKIDQKVNEYSGRLSELPQ